MGTALYVVLKEKVPAADQIVVDGKMLALAADHLAEAAKRLRVPPLEQFFSVDPATAAALMDLEPGDAALPEERWFSPKAGLKTVRALLKDLRKGTADVEGKGQVIEDLVGIEKVLMVADEAGTQFHVALDI
ncbi:MAG: hypothetical protein ACXWLR_12560 [Myxococcales bacterium]